MEVRRNQRGISVFQVTFTHAGTYQGVRRLRSRIRSRPLVSADALQRVGCHFQRVDFAIQLACLDVIDFLSNCCNVKSDPIFTSAVQAIGSTYTDWVVFLTEMHCLQKACQISYFLEPSRPGAQTRGHRVAFGPRCFLGQKLFSLFTGV